jgi:hypothetical protein
MLSYNSIKSGILRFSGARAGGLHQNWADGWVSSTPQAADRGAAGGTSESRSAEIPPPAPLSQKGIDAQDLFPDTAHSVMLLHFFFTILY